ncbi:MAG: sulfite exporter TauE/SafE family protein [Bacteroidota bacterium]|nr:sulfite exporter TauE/SafE family protein [Bacteroidota bacterium]
MEIILTGLILGLMGSFHCAGMCGPIAIALPLRGDNYFQKVTGGVLYNLGRTVTYGLMGAIFGLLGQGVEMLGFQQWVSVIMGTLMIISVLFPQLFKKQYDLNTSMFSIIGKLKNALKKLFTQKSYKALFLIGLLNGYLPCGLVYIALAGAIGTGSVLNGTLFMILFGLGTLPMLLGISLLGNMASAKLRNKVNKFIPVVVVFVGIIFILSGLNLGIPYISPKKEMIDKKFEREMKKHEPALQSNIETIDLSNYFVAS